MLYIREYSDRVLSVSKSGGNAVFIRLILKNFIHEVENNVNRGDDWEKCGWKIKHCQNHK